MGACSSSPSSDGPSPSPSVIPDHVTSNNNNNNNNNNINSNTNGNNKQNDHHSQSQTDTASPTKSRPSSDNSKTNNTNGNNVVNYNNINVAAASSSSSSSSPSSPSTNSNSTRQSVSNKSVTVPSTSPRSYRESESLFSAEEDFRQTLKSVLICVLEKFCKALEYEKDAFHDLSNKLSKSNSQNTNNIMDIVNYQSFTEFFTNQFDVKSTPSDVSKVFSSDPKLVEIQKFISLLERVKEAPYKKGYNKNAMVKQIQQANAGAQKNITQAISSSDSSDLKLHLAFFGRALNFIDGDIQNNAATLFSNIDKIVEIQK